MRSERARPLLLPSDRRWGEDAGPAPRRDYAELARILGNAPLLFPPAPDSGIAARVEERSASDLRQAIQAARRFRSVSVYVSFSEKIGLPLSLLLAARRIRVPHVLIAHHLTSARKRTLQARTNWLRRFTHVVVVSEAQAEYLRSEAGYPAQNITFLPHAVDTEFWDADSHPSAPSLASERGGTGESEPFVLSVGRERRDYETLLAAARILASLRFVVVTSSLWQQNSPSFASERGGRGVRGYAGLTFLELHDLYARAAAVVVPLEGGTRYAAGATALLEAMAMRKPAIVTDTPGLTGYAVDGETVRLVPASDPAALADTLRVLLADAEESRRLGERARCVVLARHTLDGYVATLAGIVREAEAEPQR